MAWLRLSVEGRTIRKWSSASAGKMKTTLAIEE
jgi:hypothetical protein